MKMPQYLKPTKILDFNELTIKDLVESKAWKSLNPVDRVGAIYRFVKDEVKFGYNQSDDIPASLVIVDGYGQCNTKGSLLMALFRAVSIPCRFHGFTIDQELQRGAIPSFLIGLAPKYIIHSWVEVYLNDQWINLEGFILDEGYLRAIQTKFASIKGEFCGYGVATNCLANPPVDWQGTDTYIQKEGIHDDFGVFDSPDDFYAEHGTNLFGIKKILYQYFIRHVINQNVNRLRNSQ